MVPNLGIFIFPQTFLSIKYQGCLFELWEHCFFKFQLKSSQIRHVVVSWNFPIRQSRRCWTQIRQISFQIPASKYPNKVFLIPNLDILIPLQSFIVWQMGECWFHIRRYCFESPAAIYQNKVFLVPKLRIFIFHKVWQFGKFEGADFKYQYNFLKL